jgi:glucose-6-phosphate isomerase
VLGALIALFERAVGFYASFVHINAYHQPGVEAGKKAAQAIIALQAKVIDALAAAGAGGTAEELATRAGISDIESVWHVCEQLAANGRATRVTSGSPQQRRYRS